MILLQDMMDFFEILAPSHSAEKWDPVGLQVGDPRQSIHSVALSLDIDLPCIQFLKTQTVDLVITHHPLFFKPLNSLLFNSEMDQILSVLLQKRCAVLSHHTNLDKAKGGINDSFCNAYGFDPALGTSIGFLKVLQNSAHTLHSLEKILPCISYDYHHGPIHQIGFCAGSAHGVMKDVLKSDIQCLITGELTHHDLVSCQFQKISVITVGHHASEIIGLRRLSSLIKTQFPSLRLLSDLIY